MVGLALLAVGSATWIVFRVDRDGVGSAVPQTMRADGFSRAEYIFEATRGTSERRQYRLEAAPGVARIIQVRHENHRDIVVIQSGVVGGEWKLLAADPPDAGATTAPREVAAAQVHPDWSDHNANGFPDNLELQNTADAKAFLDWFRYLAEEQFYRDDNALHPEVKDCAGLLRYAYREALRRHDGEWATRLGLRTLQPIPTVEQYNYPFTQLRANLFRLRPGPFAPEDLNDGGFGQFADAENLLLYNAIRIGKDIGQAQPGDLLFYRQENQGMPFHAMLYMGESMIEPQDGIEYVLYHTGPDGDSPGEMRRRTVRDMLRHPEARWHPVPVNPAFLGVYRWKIVAERLGG
jgi:uncharacterized protein YfaT (DUF1175 family)